LKYFLDPFGCVKNQVDAETMMAFLGDAGWKAAAVPEEAQLIIVNSCGFIESAKQESINAVLRWRKLFPDKKILLEGCLAQRYGRELAEALPEADLLFGNGDPGLIAAAARQALGAGGKNAGDSAGEPAPGAGGSGAASPVSPAGGRRPLLSLPGSAYVKISEGCDNRCSFCAIPLIRGGLRCRSIAAVLEECRVLLDRGVRELCLIGQDLGSYKPGLPGLLGALAALPGDFWVRLLYIHPDNFPLPILDIMEEDGRFLPYFDIPFQHASEKILRAMNRRGNREHYIRLLSLIRSRLPGAVIRSTFMTGFPGETEEDFEILLDFQKQAMIDWMGCFAYSREEDTPAWGMKNRVGKKTSLERKTLLEERQIPIMEKQMDRFIGRSFDALVEETFADAGGGTIYLGRLFCHAPEVDGSAVISAGRELKPGDLVRGRVTARAGFDLEFRVDRGIDKFQMSRALPKLRS
jgi:ribosomal protein S12 methylthiotransferase